MRRRFDSDWTHHNLRLDITMGYSTSYSLVASDMELLDKEIIPFREDSQSDWGFLYRSKDGCYRATCKWYEHETDVAALSSKFPTVLFTLDGQGEELGDVWRKFFLGGKVHQAEMKFEFFDPAKLIDPRRI